MNRDYAEHNYQIDNLRAIAITMVVFGHSIILYSSSWNIYTTSYSVPSLDYIKELINIIQMPLYFAISGFLFVLSVEERTLTQMAINKFRRLMIPYFAFALFWMVPIRLFVGYPGYKGVSLSDILIVDILYGADNGHLWFLQTLFWCFILSGVVSKCIIRSCSENKNKIEIATFTLFVVSIVMAIECRRHNIYYFGSVFQYLFWFVIGEVVHLKYSLIRNISVFPKVFLVGATVLLTVNTLFWHRNTGGVAEVLLSYINPILWLVLLFCIVPSRKNKVMMFVSSVSFGVYLFHSPFVYITYTYLAETTPVIVVLINFVIFGTVSVFLTMIIKKSKAKFLIGE